MKVVFVCGYFEKCCEKEVMEKTKTYVDFAANEFQRKLIEGFRANGNDLTVLSAPYVGAYPTVYKDKSFKGFKSNSEENITYLDFCNIWGFRNIFRAKAMARALKKYCKENVAEDIFIIMYAPHTPFVEAMSKAKRVHKNIKSCLIVPDLPQFMNMSSKKHRIYDFFKSIDLKKFYKLNAKVDSYVLLTEPMKEVLDIKDKSYIVVEGICEQIKEPLLKDREIKQIVYTGKLEEKFGVRDLVMAFEKIKKENFRLILCGNGELSPWIKERAYNDKRIDFRGQVPISEARQIIADADVLVNPRKNNEEYTKYSFPSKTIDYLCSGNPVVAYKLDGMPNAYRDFVWMPKSDSLEDLANTICLAIDTKRDNNFKEYAESITAKGVTRRILSMMRSV